MKKYNLIFDASFLTNEFHINSARSGIFFVAKNIFNELLKREDINLSLWCEVGKLAALKKYLKLYNHEDIPIINEKIYGFFEKLKETSRNDKDKYLRKEHPVLRTMAILKYNIAALIVNLKSNFLYPVILAKSLKNIDLYFSPCNEVPMAIKKTNHILSSVYLHDVIPILFSRFSQTRVCKKHWFIRLIDNLDNNEFYFANSECTKKDFLKYVPKLKEEQIKVSYLAASEEFRNLKNDEKINSIKEKYNIPKGQYIFSLCTLEPRKNLIFTIKNFINFIKKNNIEDLYFVLGGSAWDKFIPVLEKEISDLDNYKSKIIKAGYVEDEDLPYLYSNAFCFTYISKYEGFGMPVLEAMQCGVPVITSNISSIPEVIGNAGIQIDPNDNKECVKAFEEMYYNENKREEYSRLGLERAKEFSWQKCTDIIVSELIKRRKND